MKFNSPKANIENFCPDPDEIKLKVRPNPMKAKSRPKQYYKILLNAMKIEIAINEFYSLVKFSNQAETLIWVISIALYFSGNKEYPLVYLNTIHVLRAILGFIVTFKLPKSFDIVKYIDSNPHLMELGNFNDIIRESVKQKVLPQLKSMKCLLITYFTLTFINFIVDIIDFLYVISYFNSQGPSLQMVTLTFLVLNFMYIGILFIYKVIDLFYVFWTSSLRYTFSSDLLNPLHQSFSGTFKRLIRRMKLGWKPTVEKTDDQKFNSEAANPHFIPPSQLSTEPTNIVKLENKSNIKALRNKDYESLQIDFDQQDFKVDMGKRKSFLNRSFQAKSSNGIKNVNSN
jgi:hypothetical protein